MRISAHAMLLACAIAATGCARDAAPDLVPGTLRALGVVSRDERAMMTVTLRDKVFYGRYAIAPQYHAIPEHFGGARSLARSDLDLGGQGNGRATLADHEGAPLYCVFDVEPVTFYGGGECQDEQGRLYDLTVAAE